MKKLLLGILLAACVSSASAHGPRQGYSGHGLGYFGGGLVLGALIAQPRVLYPSTFYYAPAPVYVQPPVSYLPAPTYVQPSTITTYVAPVPVEERLRRLRSICDQGLVSPTECAQKRAQILQEY